MTHNARVYLFTEAILAGFGGFILPIYVLYFRYYEVGLFEVAVLAGVFEAAVLISELPTGLFADRFGRKVSVVTGFALFVASGSIFIFFRDFNGFVVGEILFGVAEAFISGAGEALAVESLPDDDRQGRLAQLFTRRSRIRIAVTTAAMVMAGYAFSQNISITFIPVAIGGGLGLMVSLFFTDKRGRQSDQPSSFWVPLRMMLDRLRLKPILRVAFLLALMANFAFEGVDQYWQVLLSELYEIDIRWFGVLTAGGALAAFILVGPVVRRFAGTMAMPMIILIFVGALISFLPNAPGLALPYLMILYFAGKELISPMFSVSINEAIDNTGRATFLSAYNMTCSVGEVGSALLIGIIASRLGLPLVFIVGGGGLVVTVVVMVFTSGSYLCRPSSEK